MGYGFFKVGEPELMLIFCVFFNAFEILANYGFSLLQLIIKNEDNNFEFYFGQHSKFKTNKNFGINSLFYYNTSMWFCLIIVLILIAYVQENHMKLSKGFGHILNGFFVLYFGFSFYFGVFMKP